MDKIKSKFFKAIAETDTLSNVAEIESLAETDFEKFLVNKMNGVETKDFDLEKQFCDIFNSYCKMSGSSDTIYGEIVRGVNKLLYRYHNDGDDVYCGPYSGIWTYLYNKLYVPFIYDDGGVSWDNEYNNFNELFSHIMGGCNIVDNLIVNTMILECFEYCHRPNKDFDISESYHNIVEDFVDKDIIDKFKKYDIDLTNQMGMYVSSPIGGYDSEIQINSISEDLYITFSNGKITIDWNPSMSLNFKMEFNRKDLDKILEKHGKLFKVLFEQAQFNYLKFDSEAVENIKRIVLELGYEISGKKIVPKIENKYRKFREYDNAIQFIKNRISDNNNQMITRKLNIILKELGDIAEKDLEEYTEERSFVDDYE